MFLSLSLLLLSGLLLGECSKKLKLPSLFGMLLAGILLGPYGFNLLDASLLNISAEIRKIALVIILMRAGLSLEVGSLKAIGRPALLMCFLPATLEVLGVVLLAAPLLQFSRMEAALLGAVLAAVSPAVVVPRMIKLMEERYGTDKNIPQLILAGASVDDVYVIVLFSTFLHILQGSRASVLDFINIPVSVLLGILIGFCTGYLLSKLFLKLHIRDTQKMIILLALALLLCALEDMLTTPITFSSLIAVMFIGIGMKPGRPQAAERLSIRFNKLWIAAEIFLFVLVGASVNIGSLTKVGPFAVVLVLGALLFRMAGVFLCLLGTKLSGKERLFTMLAYTPKATVQAAIGGIPLAAGLACGDVILTTAVLAIVVTAPLGAFAIDSSYTKLLTKE